MIDYKENWDLTQLYKSIDDPQIEKDFDTAVQLYEDMIKYFKENPEAQKTVEGNLYNYETNGKISDLTHKIYYYIMYLQTLDSNNDKADKLEHKFDHKFDELSRTAEFINQLFKTALSEDPNLYHLLYNDERLEPYRHGIKSFYEQMHYQLSEEVENALDLSSMGDRNIAIYDQYTTNLKYPFRGEMLTNTEVSKYLKSEDRSERRDAFLSIKMITNQKVNKIFFGNQYFQVISDWVNNVKLRGYDSPISLRNLAENLDDETTDTLIDVTTKNYGLVSEYLKLKQKYLGLETFEDYDRNAEISLPNQEFTLKDSVEIYLKLIKEFNPYFYERSVAIMEEGRMDAFPSDAKRGGAYAANMRDGNGSWVMLNHQDSLYDLSTLAHEFGHAMHYEVMNRDNPDSKVGTPLCMAETASIFNELLLNDYYLETYKDKPELIVPYLFSEIDGYLNTIYRQVMYTKFELEVHDKVMNGQLLLGDDFEEIWSKNYRDLYPDMNTINNTHWANIPHFRHTPFYCYTYAFGNLFALTLYKKYLKSKENGSKGEFVKEYETILSQTGYKKPKEILIC